jgi:uncharacterized protein
VALAAALAAATACAGGGDGPAATVDDAAGLLDPAQRAQIERQHRALRRDHDVDYRVQTAVNVGDVDAYAVRRFEALDVGSRSRRHRGLLLVIDPGQDVVRLEVSRSLEGVFPDAFVAYLERRQMVPFFRADRAADGILAATELLVTRIQRARARVAYDEEEWMGGSGGAGARAPAELGRGPDPSFRSGPEVAAGTSPDATVGAYLRAMEARNGASALAVYSAGTRAFLRDRVVTPAQMDSVARSYRRCHPEPAHTRGDRAVIRYPVSERACAPWFLVREEGRWRLDLETASRVIRFGRDNAWHFGVAAEHPYAFAFGDWTLDRHGYPQAPRREARDRS